MFDPSLLELAQFAPDNNAVKEYIKTTKSSWSKGNYWLGGQISLSPTNKITDELCNKVREIYKIDYVCCNSFEIASMNDSKTLFVEIQVVIKQFREMMKPRTLDELNKTKLNQDVNKIIVSLCE
jgi:hypothetical protein